MNEDTQSGWFDDIDRIVADELRFKARLRIGEDAYDLSRVGKVAAELWSSAGAAGTAVLVVQSAPIATTFFAPAGMLSLLGIGTAVTPIGWVAASAVLAGAGWIGVMRFLRQSIGNRTTTIPDFINTPLDVLALALFDLMAPIALKLGSADGDIDPAERELMNTYFVTEWGFDDHFVREGLAFTERRMPDFSIKELAQALAELKKNNKDCNYKEMSREFLDFLREIIEADGRIDPAEESAIKEVQAVFDSAGRSALVKTTRKMTVFITDTTSGGKQTLSQFVGKITDAFPGFNKRPAQRTEPRESIAGSSPSEK